LSTDSARSTGTRPISFNEARTAAFVMELLAF
jgi:hypothetical protein